MNINSLHKQAMELAEKAFIEKFHNESTGKELFRKAFELEKKAALIIHAKSGEEPTRSVLLQSASSLAINCEEYREAEKLISLGLSGNPPFEIAEDLRNLLEEVNFGRHLRLNNIILDTSEIQLSVAGDNVGYGMVKSEDFWDRINIFEKLTYRTAERRLGKPFREKGQITKIIKENFEPYISVPRAACFAVSIRIGRPTSQLQIPGMENSLEIIDDIINGIELIDQSNELELRKKIKDNTYYRNFAALAKEFAPDGEKIKLVGLTVIRNKKEKRVALTRTQSDIKFTDSDLDKSPDILEKSKKKKIEVIGTLSYAAAKQRKIKITQEDGKSYSIKVPEGLMSDIVKPYWEDIVKIKGTLSGKTILLEDFSKVD